MNEENESIEERISNLLDIEHVEVEVIEPEIQKENQLVLVEDPIQNSIERKKHVEQDYETTRNVCTDMIDKGTMAIDELLTIASETQHPRAYEVLSALMRNVADMTDKLITLHKNMKEIDGTTTQSTGESKTINNNLFVGSTHELQKLLKDSKVEME